jgi:hypothetical protein
LVKAIFEPGDYNPDARCSGADIEENAQNDFAAWKQSFGNSLPSN